MQAVLILFLILAVLLVIFTLQNQMEVGIQLLFWEIKDVPLVLLIIACLVIGYVLAAIYFYPRLWKTKRELKKLLRFNKELKQLHDLDHPKKEKTEDVTDPEGIEFDDDDDDSSFFK